MERWDVTSVCCCWECIKPSNHSNDDKLRLVSLLLAVNRRHVGLLHLYLNPAKILAGAENGRICQNGQMTYWSRGWNPVRCSNKCHKTMTVVCCCVYTVLIYNEWSSAIVHMLCCVVIVHCFVPLLTGDRMFHFWLQMYNAIDEMRTDLLRGIFAAIV